MKVTFGIIGAMDCEIEELKSLMTGVKEKIVSGMTFYKGKLSGKRVVLVKSGVGKVFAGIATQTLILKFNVSVVINIGVAGSVSDLKIGDIAVSSAVCQHDMDTSALGDEVGLISGINKVYIDADMVLASLAEKTAKLLGYNAKIGVIASGDKFVCENDEKLRIAKTFHALCVEMEGASVGQVSFVNKLPFVILRSISDDGTGEHKVEFMTFATESAKKVSLLVKSMLENF